MATPASRSRFFLLCAFLCASVSSYAQTTLTGAIEFSTNNGGAAGSQVWNTYSDGNYDLWLAKNPDATSPINGPSDAESSISIPLQAGNTYTYYIFGQPGSIYNVAGLNLFFDGDNSTPAISIFGVLNTTTFKLNSNKTLTFTRTPVQGSGNSFYTGSGVTVVLNNYQWSTP